LVSSSDFVEASPLDITEVQELDKDDIPSELELQTYIEQERKKLEVRKSFLDALPAPAIAPHLPLKMFPRFALSKIHQSKTH
jgi:hypothetical protein